MHAQLQVAGPQVLDRVNSLIAAMDSGNHSKELNVNYGTIGLFARKTVLLNQHAYIMLEGISKFGQRYLIKGELRVGSNEKIIITISPCSPQGFQKFAREELVLCNTARIASTKIKDVLRAMCYSRDQEGFIKYALLANYTEKGVFSCIKWANIMLEVAGIETVESWFPSRAVGYKCSIL